jgi:hypothetical protein
MDDKIEYGEHTTYFLGRDGRLASSGLQIAHGDGTTVLTPLTSKGMAGRGFIEVPNEKVRAIAYALLAISRDYESQAAKEKGVEPSKINCLNIGGLIRPAAFGKAARSSPIEFVARISETTELSVARGLSWLPNP